MILSVPCAGLRTLVALTVAVPAAANPDWRTHRLVPGWKCGSQAAEVWLGEPG
jgi:hypothetical protein